MNHNKKEQSYPDSRRGDIVDSINHPQVKRIRALHRRDDRDRTRLYYVEGMRMVAQAITFHAHIEVLVTCPPLLKNPFAQRLVAQQRRAGTPVLEVTPPVMYSMALLDDPQGIGAVVRQKWLPLERVKLGGKLCWLAAESVHSPGNLGTILRTSDAVGGAGLLLLGDSADPYDPATVRATMGALFSQRFVRTSVEELGPWKEARQWQLVGTSPSGSVSYRQADYSKPTIVCLGSERRGLSPELQALCDVMVSIPMVGHGDSLNVAVATAVVLYELFDRKHGDQHHADHAAQLAEPSPPSEPSPDP